MSKVGIAHPINGITLNDELEFLLDDNDEVRVFGSKDQAWTFLLAAGVDPDKPRCMVIVESKPTRTRDN